MDGAGTKTSSDFGAGSLSVVYRYLLGCSFGSGEYPGCDSVSVFEEIATVIPVSAPVPGNMYANACMLMQAYANA